MNQQIETLPKGQQPEGSATEREDDHDQEVEVIQPGTQEVRLGIGKKFGQDGCGY